MAFWDPYEHFFHFGSLELRPLYEEFNTIAGWTPTKIEVIVFTNQTVIYPGIGSTLFELSPNKLDELVTPDKRLFPLQLLGDYSKKTPGSPPWACILSYYLFL